jgi:SAM-dependent methyltransferase
MADWERFAREDPYFYISTTKGGPPRTAEERRAFLELGVENAHALIREVEDDLPGWSRAVEIGCGIGRLLLAHARRFAEVRGVDISPTMLAGLRALAAEDGLSNVRTYLPDEPWDAPPGTADYIFSSLVFQHIEDDATIAGYVLRTARALRPGGIAQFQFDTRHASVLSDARRRMPDALLPRTQRRGIRRVRRDAAWIRQLALGAGLRILRERDPDSAVHVFVLRRGSDP